MSLPSPSSPHVPHSSLIILLFSSSPPHFIFLPISCHVTPMGIYIHGCICGNKPKSLMPFVPHPGLIPYILLHPLCIPPQSLGILQRLWISTQSHTTNLHVLAQIFPGHFTLEAPTVPLCISVPPIIYLYNHSSALQLQKLEDVCWFRQPIGSCCLQATRFCDTGLVCTTLYPYISAVLNTTYYSLNIVFL